MRPTPAESLFCGSSASVFDGLRDVSVAEVLDQADADQGHNEQAGEHRDECGVAVGLIRRVGNYERERNTLIAQTYGLYSVYFALRGLCRIRQSVRKQVPMHLLTTKSAGAEEGGCL